MIAGAPDRTDAEPLGGDGVELAIAMPRNQDLGAVALLVLMNGVMKCWPCQNAKIAGISGSTMS